MACPLRVFLFLFSLLLLGAALAYHLAGRDAAFFTRREGRTWRAFLTALCTGELLYDAYHGAGAWQGSAGSGGTPLTLAQRSSRECHACVAVGQRDSGDTGRSKSSSTPPPPKPLGENNWFGYWPGGGRGLPQTFFASM